MTRLVDSREMTASDLLDCCLDVQTIIRLCACAVEAIDDEAGYAFDLGDVARLLRLAGELSQPAFDAVAYHEGRQARLPRDRKAAAA